MSQQNLELVRRVYEGWARGDFSASDAFDPDVEFEMPDWPHSAGSRGLEGMSDTWRTTLAAWDDFRAEPERFIDTGDHVVVLNHVHAWGKESGAEVSADTATVWTVRDGKVVRLVLYWNSDNALDSVGVDR